MVKLRVFGGRVFRGAFVLSAFVVGGTLRERRNIRPSSSAESTSTVRPVVIDGHPWEAGDTRNLQSRDQAFENQEVPLDPPTDPDRARMIRSSRWGGSVNMTFANIPKGTYQVFLYVWEDNNSETFSIRLDDREVLRDFASGGAGSWKKLGPWQVSSDSGAIQLTTQGGAANLSGVEIWKGSAAVPDPGSGTPDPAPLAPRDPVAVKTFDEKVAPLLARNCLECHGGSIRKGGLNLATEKAARDGGDSGDPIEPGKPQESLLWEQIESGAMPKGRPKMSAAEKDVIKRWITDGATWGTPEIDPFVATTDRRAGYDWWSLQPIQRPALPAVKAASWPRNDIDRFVLAKLESKGLAPSAEADRRTLIRRLSFDLIGLPPEPDDVEKFIADESKDAYESSSTGFSIRPTTASDGPATGSTWCDSARARATSAPHPRERLALSRLGDRLVQPRPALRRVHEVANRRGRAQPEGPRLADRHRIPRLRHLGPGRAQRRLRGDEEGDAVG